MAALGVIAGNSAFPLIFSKAATEQGFEVVAVAHEGETPAEIIEHAAQVTWVRVGELGKIIETFQEAGVQQAVMAGGIYKAGAMTGICPDARGIALISRLPSLRDDVILRAVASELEEEGIAIVECTRFLSALVPEVGVLTRKRPSADQEENIQLGMSAAQEIGRWDVGQSVVVKRGTVLAVEGVEGTNAAIKRGGEFGGEGCIVVKMSKPQQDLRFDVPTIGPDTIAVMEQVKADVLAVEAGKTLMIDRSNVVKNAEAAGIVVVAIDGNHTVGACSS